MNWNLATPVFEQAARSPQRLALAADGFERTYAELVARACSLATVLGAQGLGRGNRVGILGSRSLIAVEAVLGVAWAGATYVPLGLRWPHARIQAAMGLAGLDALIADGAGVDMLTADLLDGITLLVVPDDRHADAWRSIPNLQTQSLASVSATPQATAPAAMSHDDLAYLVFTSGTTGMPKGVMVPTRAVAAYLAALGERKAMTPDDRASQFTELTFDPSIGEILLPWHCGASLHVVPAVSHVSPAKFIRDHRLSIWGSAPAAAAWMRDTRSLQPGTLPTLRYSSFGGEPLPLALVEAWQAAAPNSVVDNLYGPTEATVDCVGQRVEPGAKPIVTPGRGVLAIGTPHPGTELAVLDAELRPVARGEPGELAIAGSQLSLGYLGNALATSERFPVIGGKRWYLTGDIALQDAAGIYHHLGRSDNQIKIHGHRVELEDIEAHTRTVAESDQVAAVAWPMADGVASAIVCFVASSEHPANKVREALRQRLPGYMVPTTIYRIAALPLNSNGKLDRGALIAQLENGTAGQDATRTE